jgi:hypothetical protein
MKQRQQKRAEIRKKQEERRNIEGIWKMEEFKAKRCVISAKIIF